MFGGILIYILIAGIIFRFLTSCGWPEKAPFKPCK